MLYFFKKYATLSHGQACIWAASMSILFMPFLAASIANVVISDGLKAMS
jgi:hypothetical protein